MPTSDKYYLVLVFSERTATKNMLEHKKNFLLLFRKHHTLLHNQWDSGIHFFKFIIQKCEERWASKNFSRLFQTRMTKRLRFKNDKIATSLTVFLAGYGSVARKGNQRFLIGWTQLEALPRYVNSKLSFWLVRFWCAFSSFRSASMSFLVFSWTVTWDKRYYNTVKVPCHCPNFILIKSELMNSAKVIITKKRITFGLTDWTLILNFFNLLLSELLGLV